MPVQIVATVTTAGAAGTPRVELSCLVSASEGAKIRHALERLLDSWPHRDAEDAWRVALRVIHTDDAGGARWTTAALYRRICRSVPIEQLRAELEVELTR